MREQLIKILNGKPCVKPCTEDCQYYTDNGCDKSALVADYLIQNGVTVATDNDVGDKVTPTEEIEFDYGAEV